jgi:putative flippase GtrA
MWLAGRSPVLSASMKVSPTALLEHARSTEGRKQLRYAGVSLVFVPVGQVLIQVLGALVFSEEVMVNGEMVKEINWTLASITSAAILTLPNFFANKYLVWKETSSDNLHTQVVVFWVAAMLGVTFATLLTFLVDSLIEGHGWIEKVAVFCAQLTGFGIVWLGRYIILDRWIFKITHDGEEPDPDELDMAHGDIPI